MARADEGRPQPCITVAAQACRRPQSPIARLAGPCVPFPSPPERSTEDSNPEGFRLASVATQACRRPRTPAFAGPWRITRASCADVDAVQNGCMDSSLSHGHAAWRYHSGRTLVSVVTADPGIVGRGRIGRVAQGPSGSRVTARNSNAAITTAPAIVLVPIVLIGCSRLYSDSSVPATESPNIACC